MGLPFRSYECVTLDLKIQAGQSSEISEYKIAK